MAYITTSAATAYTLQDFIDFKSSDSFTYYNFSILEVMNNVEHLDLNLIEYYIEELKSVCTTVELSKTELRKYRYSPDLLAYDLYGSVQLDFLILLLNDMVDPKEFDKQRLILPYSSILSTYLNKIYSKELEYIKSNRSAQGIKNVIN